MVRGSNCESRLGRTKMLAAYPRGGPPGFLNINVISDGITRLPVVEGQVSHVELPRPAHRPLGITIVGGADTALRCVVVQEVFPGGVIAEDGRLQPGDQIVEVDGTDMTSATHGQMCQVLKKNSSSSLRLGIYREEIKAYRSTTSRICEDTAAYITLKKTRDQPFGIHLGCHSTRPGIFIVKITPKSTAALDGRLKVSDQILAINGHDVRNLKLNSATRLIERSKVCVTISKKDLFYCNSDGSSLHSSTSGSSFSELSSNTSSPRNFSNCCVQESDLCSCGDDDRLTPKWHVPFAQRSSSSSDGSTTGDDNDGVSGSNSDASRVTGFVDRKEPDSGGSWPPLPLKPKLSQKSVLIKKAPGESLGMRIGGGARSNDGDTPVYVAHIDADGPVARCRKLQKGDIILTVDHKSLLGLTHHQAVTQLKSTFESSHVHLTVLESPEPAPKDSAALNFVPTWLYWQKLPRPLQISRSVVLHRSLGSSLGFSIVGGTDPTRGSEPIHVLLVVASSPAAQDGKLRCGDRILAVDNYSLDNISHSAAVSLLKQAGTEVHIEVISWLGSEL